MSMYGKTNKKKFFFSVIVISWIFNTPDVFNQLQLFLLILKLWESFQAGSSVFSRLA